MPLGRSPISSAPVSGRALELPVPFAWRGQTVDLTLVTRLYREDGTSVEIVNERRGVVKSAKKLRNLLSLEIADVDRSALDNQIPSKKFTTADFPRLFIDHVNNPVPQGVGEVQKIPLAYIDSAGPPFRYAVCEVLPAGTPQVRTVYRNGRVVAATEYTTDTVVAGGTTYLRINFTLEQKDFSNSLYELTADLSCPGSRNSSDEVQRILQLLGASTDPTIYALASAVCSLYNMRVDCAYVEPRAGTAILADLLLVARGQLTKTPAGNYGIWIDKPRDCTRAFDDTADEVSVDSYSLPDIKRTFTLEYRPTAAADEGNLLGALTRTTSGAVGQQDFKNAYVRDHEVADRLLCYLAAKESAKATAAVAIQGVQLQMGEVIDLTSPLNWVGSKRFLAPSITRPGDVNSGDLTEYVESVYTYVPGTLPADATNVYSPDYSQTPPAAPTSLAVVSQSAPSNADGPVVALALIHALPPAVNWEKLTVQVTDTITNEIYQAQLLFNAGTGFYEATVSGMRPNHVSNVVCWATNSNSVDGAITAPVAFTTATNSTVPSAPSTAVIQQTQGQELDYGWAKVADVAGNPHIRTYIVEEKQGAGAFSEIWRGDAQAYKRTNIGNGVSVQFRVSTLDDNGNQSATKSSNTVTTQGTIGDAWAAPQGFGGNSIANSSINRGRTSNTTGSSAGTFPFSSGGLQIAMDQYTFAPMVFSSGGETLRGGSSGLGNDTGTVTFTMISSANTYDVRWRTFLT